MNFAPFFFYVRAPVNVYIWIKSRLEAVHWLRYTREKERHLIIERRREKERDVWSMHLVKIIKVHGEIPLELVNVTGLHIVVQGQVTDPLSLFFLFNLSTHVYVSLYPRSS